MLTTIIAAVVVVVVILASAGAWHFSRRSVPFGKGIAIARNAVEEATGSAPWPVMHVAPRQLRAAVYPLHGDIAVVFGAAQDLHEIGDPVESLTPQVANTLAAGNVALQAVEGMKTAQAGGQIVRLLPEFVEALKAGAITKDAGGVILGVARDASGQVSQLARFTEVGGAAAVSVANVGMAVALLGIQLQLQQISKQLGRIEAKIADVHEHLRDELVASVKANSDALLEAGHKFQATGVIDDDEWIRLAPYDKTLRQNVLQLEAKLRRSLDALGQVPGQNSDRDASSRLKLLAELDQREAPRLWLQLYYEAQRAVVMYEQLQIFRRLSANSPDLEIHRNAGMERSRAAIQQLADTLQRADQALQAAASGKTDHGFWDHVPWVKHDFTTTMHLDEHHEVLRNALDGVRESLRPMTEGVLPLHQMLDYASPDHVLPSDRDEADTGLPTSGDDSTQNVVED